MRFFGLDFSRWWGGKLDVVNVVGGHLTTSLVFFCFVFFRAYRTLTIVVFWDPGSVSHLMSRLLHKSSL